MIKDALRDTYEMQILFFIEFLIDQLILMTV